jgi:hypothetical protein
VGAIYRDHDPGRDSSLEVIIGPEDIATARTTQQPPVTRLGGFKPTGNSLHVFGKSFNGGNGVFLNRLFVPANS